MPRGTTLWECKGLYDGRYMAVQQTDGDFVIYDLASSGSAVWRTNTAGVGAGPYKAVYQTNGDFVIYSGDKIVWNSDTAGIPSNKLELSGTLYIKDGNVIKWNSTYPRAATNYSPDGPCTGFDRSLYKLLGSSVSSGSTIGQCQGLFDGRYMSVQQSDGDFVIYDILNKTSKWNTNTGGQGTGPYKAVYQTNGDFGVYSGDKMLWNSGTAGIPSTSLSLATSLSLYDTNVIKWNSTYPKPGTNYNPSGPCTGYSPSQYQYLGASVVSGTSINQCQGLFNGRYSAVQQSDGNFVIYDNISGPGRIMWSTSTSGKGTGPYKAIYQPDGNFVIYSSDNTKLWDSDTANVQSNNLTLTDRMLYIKQDGGPKWANTYSRASTTYNPSGPCVGYDRSPYKFLGASVPSNTTIEQCQGLFDGRYTAVQQSDGNFVVYDLLQDGAKKWESGTANSGTGPYQAVYDANGNFSIMSGASSVYTATKPAPLTVRSFP